VVQHTGVEETVAELVARFLVGDGALFGLAIGRCFALALHGSGGGGSGVRGASFLEVSSLLVIGGWWLGPGGRDRGKASKQAVDVEEGKEKSRKKKKRRTEMQGQEKKKGDSGAAERSRSSLFRKA
jgi:hypothetical protein